MLLHSNKRHHPQAHPGSIAVFITNETTTPAYYKGEDKSRLIPNVIFRMGAAAMLLSNKPVVVGTGGRRLAPKYKLLHHERVHIGAKENAYK